jgi:hypothetical protein
MPVPIPMIDLEFLKLQRGMLLVKLECKGEIKLEC